MSCFRYSLSSVSLGCSVSNSGIRDMQGVDRTNFTFVQDVEHPTGNEDFYIKVDATDGTKYVMISEAAIEALFTEGGAKAAADIKLRKNTAAISGEKQDDDSWLNSLGPVQIGSLNAVAHANAEAMIGGDYGYIVRDRNNRCYFLGIMAPCICSAANFNSGTQVTDYSGYELTLQERSVESIFEIRYKNGTEDTNLANNEKYKAYVDK